MRKYNSVLIVEDNEADIFLAEQILRRVGITHGIEIARTGVDAIKFLDTQYSLHALLPELIIVDLHIPLLNGFQFIHELKNYESFLVEKTKIIVLTASLDSEKDRKIIEEMGVDATHTLLKPLDEQALQKIIK